MTGNSLELKILLINETFNNEGNDLTHRNNS